jgi:hypothetical protein
METMILLIALILLSLLFTASTLVAAILCLFDKKRAWLYAIVVTPSIFIGIWCGLFVAFNPNYEITFSVDFLIGALIVSINILCPLICYIQFGLWLLHGRR